eukprot:6482359-Amphidinium_carterae.1
MDDVAIRGLVIHSSVHGVILWKTALESVGSQKWFYLQATDGQPNYIVTQILDPARWKSCEVEGVSPEEVRCKAEADKVAAPRITLRMKRASPTSDLLALHATHGFLGLTIPLMQLLAREVGMGDGVLPSKEYEMVSALVAHVLKDGFDVKLIWSRRRRKPRMDIP